MCNKVAPRQINLRNQLRLLWTQHVYWTRFFIISTAAGLADLDEVTKELLQNPKRFARLFAPVYGARAAEQLQELLTQHLLIAADLVNAAKNGQKDKGKEARRKWYQNADELAAFLARMDPCWNRTKWQTMLYSHLEMTEQEAALRLQGDYTADIQVFNNIEKEALQMADYMYACMVRRDSSKCRR